MTSTTSQYAASVEVDIDRIIVPEAWRNTNPAGVAELAHSFQENGQENPVALNTDYRLLANYRNILAAKEAGWTTIRAIILEGTDALEQELVTIDEIICQDGLCPYDRCAELARRKEIYEKLYPATGQGGKREKGVAVETERFSKNTAELRGVSERTIRREVAIGRKLGGVESPILKELSLTKLETLCGMEDQDWATALNFMEEHGLSFEEACEYGTMDEKEYELTACAYSQMDWPLERANQWAKNRIRSAGESLSELRRLDDVIAGKVKVRDLLEDGEGQEDNDCEVHDRDCLVDERDCAVEHSESQTRPPAPTADCPLEMEDEDTMETVKSAEANHLVEMSDEELCERTIAEVKEHVNSVREIAEVLPVRNFAEAEKLLNEVLYYVIDEAQHRFDRRPPTNDPQGFVPFKMVFPDITDEPFDLMDSIFRK